MAKRLPLPDPLRVRIAAERAQIHRLLAGNQTAQIPGQDASVPEFAWRLKHLQSEGLFYPYPYPAEVSWADLTIAQAEVALCHGLGYKKAGKTSHWTEAGALEAATLPARSETHLSQIFNQADARNLKRLDLALLAHAHQIPVALLEAPERRTFLARVARIKAGLDPFLDQAVLLEAFAEPAPELLVAREDEIGWLSGQQSARDNGWVTRDKAWVTRPSDPVHREFKVGEPIAVWADLRERLGRSVSALLLGVDGDGAVCLLSTPRVVEDKLWHDGPVMLPRAAQLTRGHEEITADAPGPLSLALVAADDSLDGFPPYGRMFNAPASLAQQYSILTDEDFAWLRKRLLTTHPDRICVLFQTVEVLAEDYDARSDFA